MPSVPALAVLALCLVGAGRAPAAAEDFRQEAQDAMTRGDDRRAVELASRAIAADARDVRAYNLRAIGHQHLKDYSAELADVEAGLKVEPGNAALLRSRATALNRLRRSAQALKAAEATVAVDPDGYYSHYMKAVALAGLGLREESIRSLRRAAELNPGLNGKLQEALGAGPGSDLRALFDGSEAPPQAAALGWASRDRAALWAVAAAALLAALAGWRMPRRPAAAAGTPPSLAALSTPLPGLLKGQYRTARRIGMGGMGLVYEGMDEALDRRVAIKKMRDEIRTDPRERDRFVTEAKLVATLHHPNIVDIYSILEEGPDVFLIFEYVAGRTLYELIAQKERLPLAEAAPIVRQVAAALDYAHGRHLIHRDLKPSNIMIDERGQAKVMDFGVARQAKDALIKVMTNTIVGTPPYMAPEQEEGHVRRESDVFSLGVCLYEMLTGRLPFDGAGAAMQLNKKNRVYVPPSAMGLGLPQGLDKLVAWALEPDPNARLRAAGELSRQLDWFL